MKSKWLYSKREKKIENYKVVNQRRKIGNRIKDEKVEEIAYQ